MPIVAKIADLGPPGAPQLFFQKKNQNVRITVHLDVRMYIYVQIKGKGKCLDALASLAFKWSQSE